jgi:hypothetical protein
MLDLVRRRFTVDDFHKMADDGVLSSVHPVWRGDSLAPGAFEDAQLSVGDILG